MGDFEFAGGFGLGELGQGLGETFFQAIEALDGVVVSR